MAIDIVLVVFLMTLQVEASVTTIRWIGGSGEWSDSHNWDTGQVPTIFDYAILDTNGHYTVSIRGDASVENILVEENVTLVLENHAAMTTQRDMNVYGELWINYRSTLTVSGIANMWGGFYWRGGQLKSNYFGTFNIYGLSTWNLQYSYDYLSIFGGNMYIYASVDLAPPWVLYFYEGAIVHTASNGSIIFDGEGSLTVPDQSTASFDNQGQMNLLKSVTVRTKLVSTGNITISEIATLTLDADSLLTGHILAYGNLALRNSHATEHVFKPSSSLKVYGQLLCTSTVSIASHQLALKSLLLENGNCNFKVLPTAEFVEGVDEILAKKKKVPNVDYTGERLKIRTLITTYNPSVSFSKAITIERLAHEVQYHSSYYQSSIHFADSSMITESWLFPAGTISVDGTLFINGTWDIYSGYYRKYLMQGHFVLNGNSIWRHSNVFYWQNGIEIEISHHSTMTLEGHSDSASYIVGSGIQYTTLVNKGKIDAAMFPPTEFYIGQMSLVNQGEIRVNGAPPSLLYFGYQSNDIEMNNEGNITIDPGNTLVFYGKMHDSENGKTILRGSLQFATGTQSQHIETTDTGNIEVSGGQMLISSLVGNSHIAVTGGSLKFDENSVVLNELNLMDGEVNVEGTLSVYRLTMTGGKLTGHGSLSIQEEWVWDGGNVEVSHVGMIEVHGNLLLQGITEKNLGKRLYLKSNSTWYGTASLLVLAERVVIEHDVHLTLYGSHLSFKPASNSVTSLLENHGFITAILEKGHLDLGVRVENYGQITMKEGTLSLSYYTSRSGQLRVLGERLLVAAGKATFDSNSVRIPGGTLYCRDSELNIYGEIGFKNLRLQGCKTHIEDPNGISALDVILGVSLHPEEDMLILRNNPVNIRLVNGKTPHEGRVEIFYNGQWGTICDDYFKTEDANVICRQLGYWKSSGYSCCARFGRGTGPVWRLAPSCQGHEFSIYSCNTNNWRSSGCSHHEDIGVYCTGHFNYLWSPGTSNDASELTLAPAPQQIGHVIQRMELNDKSVVNIAAPTTVSKLQLIGDGQLRVGVSLTVNESMVWHQGSVQGLSQMGGITVSGEAVFSWEHEVTLSGLELKLTGNVDIWAANPLIMSQRATLALYGTTSIHSRNGKIGQSEEKGGTVFIPGTLELKGHLDVTSSLLMTGNLIITNTGTLSFIGQTYYGLHINPCSAK